jgi:hypothetical protein
MVAMVVALAARAAFARCSIRHVRWIGFTFVFRILRPGRTHGNLKHEVAERTCHWICVLA